MVCGVSVLCRHTQGGTGNKTGADGAGHIASALPTVLSLQTLDLGSTYIRHQCVRAPVPPQVVLNVTDCGVEQSTTLEMMVLVISHQPCQPFHPFRGWTSTVRISDTSV